MYSPDITDVSIRKWEIFSTVKLPNGSTEPMTTKYAFIGTKAFSLKDFKLENIKRRPLKSNSAHFGDIRSNGKSYFDGLHW